MNLKDMKVGETKVVSNVRHLTIAEVKKVCPSCAKLMKSLGMEDIEAPVVDKAGEESLSKFESWSRDRLLKTWKGMGGAVSKCIDRLKDVEAITNPGAYCAAMKDAVLKRTTWRGKGKHVKAP